MYMKTLTVSEINKYIKKTLDNDFILKNAYIKGEISNFKLHSSGHAYFSIKDDGSKLSCVMFKTYTSNLNFIPEDGMKVIIKGRISIYEKEGSYQLYCEEIKPEGMGELYLSFQKLKDKLEKQGLFSDEHKKQIPKNPLKIAVITSPTGAAIKDIINVVKRRNKNIDILIYPSLVQGVNSAKSLVSGIEILNERQDIDVIILARGGGSLEELWSFNDESLALSVFNSKIPIITGVGHETDFTMVDFVSDMRAPTPSAAAELAVPLLKIMQQDVSFYSENLDEKVNAIIMHKYYVLDMYQNTLVIKSPENLIKSKLKILEQLIEKLKDKHLQRIMLEKSKLANYVSLLNANNPLNVLNKGYSVISDENGIIIKSVQVIKNQEKISIRLADGKISANLTEFE